MRPIRIIILAPRFNDLLCIVQINKNMFIETFVPKSAIKTEVRPGLVAAEGQGQQEEKLKGAPSLAGTGRKV